MYKLFFKRFSDLLLSSIAFICLFPFLLLLAILVRIFLGSPIFFTQERVGKNNKLFKVIKFRTMTDKKDSEGNLLPDKDRITAFGDLLRKLSLDELPQLLNIIKGDMSIIGPRPLPVKYLALYTEEQRVRHHVRPGLSNLSAISGRNMLSWDEKFLKDIEYVNRMSFLLDFVIICKTVIVVLTKKGVMSQNGEFRQEFTGVNKKEQ